MNTKAFIIDPHEAENRRKAIIITSLVTGALLTVSILITFLPIKEVIGANGDGNDGLAEGIWVNFGNSETGAGLIEPTMTDIPESSPSSMETVNELTDVVTINDISPTVKVKTIK